MEKRNPLEIAKEIKQKKYPEAKALFLAGSVIRGDSTSTSDLDIVVVYDSLECAKRESYTFEEWPIEAFVHTEETLDYFHEEIESPNCELALSQMIFEAEPILTDASYAEKLKDWAKKNLDNKPDKLTTDEIDKIRYGLTDLVDDLKDFKNTPELVATGVRLYEFLSSSYFEVNQLWSGDRKYVPRLLKKNDSAFAEKFNNSFNKLFVNNNPQSVIKLTESFLQPLGGFLFDGYSSNAPKNWKLEKLNPVKLETKRLSLRYFNLEDTESIYELLKDGKVSQTTLTMPYPYKLDDAVWWVNMNLKEARKDKQFTFAIIYKETNELVGAISVVYDNDHLRGEFGYWIGEKYWNKGICTEAAEKVLDYSFNEKKLNKIVARHLIVNPSSGKVMQKIGMRKEGTLLKQVRKSDGKFLDLDLYGLTKEDYLKFRGSARDSLTLNL